MSEAVDISGLAEGTLRSSYAICGVQRSGSSLLCEALTLTRVAGFPREYFLEWEDAEWGWPRSSPSRSAFLDRVLREGTSSNGVFGVKLMWNYFPHVIDGLRALAGCPDLPPGPLLHRLFPNLRYIWIVRENRVRQAVSWALAAQTEIYSAQQLRERAPRREPQFDFELIHNLHGLILEGEAGWRAHFDACGAEPLRIVYEDLAADYEGTARRALEYLGLTPLDPIFQGEREMRRQATELNDAWVRGYLEERRKMLPEPSTGRASGPP